LKEACSAWLVMHDMTVSNCFDIIRRAPFDGFLVARSWALLAASPGVVFGSIAWLGCDEGMVRTLLAGGLDCSELEVVWGLLRWRKHQDALEHGEAPEHEVKERSEGGPNQLSPPSDPAYDEDVVDVKKKMPSAIVHCWENGMSTEESRWRWHQEIKDGEVLPPTLATCIYFENMAPHELLACKHLIPSERLASCLESVCKASTVGLVDASKARPERPQPPCRQVRRCVHCEQLAPGATDCVYHHPEALRQSAESAWPHHVDIWYYPCCDGGLFSAGCTPRAHEFQTCSQPLALVA